MDLSPEQQLAKRRATINLLLVVLPFLVLLAVHQLLRLADTLTPLTPTDEAGVPLARSAALLVGVGCAILTFRLSPGARGGARIASSAAVGLATLLLALQSGEVLISWSAQAAAFPANRTIQYRGYLHLDRVMRVSGKWGGNFVRLVPWEIDLKISNDDYNAVHGALGKVPRAADDPTNEPDVRQFCVQGVLQQAGDALRIVSEPGHILPRGSIVRCPPDTPDIPSPRRARG
jgi:hypothetical protein